MRRRAVYSLVAGVAAAAVAVLVFVTVYSAAPAELGPSVVVPSEPTSPRHGSSSDEGAAPVPGPSPSAAGDIGVDD